jgi:phage-related protein
VTAHPPDEVVEVATFDTDVVAAFVDEVVRVVPAFVDVVVAFVDVVAAFVDVVATELAVVEPVPVPVPGQTGGPGLV